MPAPGLECSPRVGTVQEPHHRRYWREWEDWICGPKLWGSRGRSGRSAPGQILGWGRSRRERATKKLQGHQLFTAPARHTPHPGTGQGQMSIRGTGKKAKGEYEEMERALTAVGNRQSQAHCKLLRSRPAQHLLVCRGLSENHPQEPPLTSNHRPRPTCPGWGRGR